MTNEEVKKDGISKYAKMCCGVLYCLKDKKFKRCRRCGTILKDETDDGKRKI